MVVRFFCVIRVLVCARVSRVCVPPPPGVFSPSTNYNRQSKEHTCQNWPNES